MKRREEPVGNPNCATRYGEPLTDVERDRVRELLRTYPDQAAYDELMVMAGWWLKPWWELRSPAQYDARQMTDHLLNDILWVREGLIE